MSTGAAVATLDDLRAWSRDAGAAAPFSPLSETPFLLFEAADVKAIEARALAAWLRGLPCPTIAIGNPGSALARAADLQVPDAPAAALAVAGIRHSPIAATVLVQLLRTTETQPLADALFAESLAYSTLQAGAEFRRWLDANRDTPAAAITDDGPAVVIERSGSALTLELNRASNRNGMSVEMRDALIEALQLVLADNSIASVIIRGRGKCFSTGGDLSEFGSTPDAATAHIVRSLALPGRQLAACSERVEVRVHGACIGSGIEFPAFAARIVATEDAHFQLPELRFGLIPGAGGCVSVARRIGRQRTAWMVLSGKRVHARTALEWGLVDAISSDPGAPA